MPSWHDPDDHPTEEERDLCRHMDVVRSLCHLGRAARQKAGIKQRQPLSKAYLKVLSADEVMAVWRFRDLILDELNVKQLEVVVNA